MGTNRLEAFSDGVIAVAITLLVLGLEVPAPHAGQSLLHALGERWPAYAAYVVSFLTIGIIWINHHVMIARLRETDHAVLILNVLLLMSIGILPFATNLMATYLRQPSGRSVAAAVYSGAFLVMALLFSALNRLILIHREGALVEALPEERRRRIFRQAFAGVIPYVLATGLAFVSPYISLGITGCVAVFYALPVASGRERRA